MISGDKLSDAVRFIDAMYKDISRLIDTVDGGMQSIDHVSLWGGACYFNGSKALSYPTAWIPHVFTRVYVPQQTVKAYSAFAFLNIYLTPKHHREPLVHWGVGRRKNGADIWLAWNPKLMGAQGPSFLRTSVIDPFEESGELSTVMEVFRHAVRPLITMDTADAVEKFILEPIRSEIATLPPPGTGPTEDTSPITPATETE
jgi:hypothetical protein